MKHWTELHTYTVDHIQKRLNCFNNYILKCKSYCAVYKSVGLLNLIFTNDSIKAQIKTVTIQIIQCLVNYFKDANVTQMKAVKWLNICF